jgi:hypothetical protein
MPSKKVKIRAVLNNAEAIDFDVDGVKPNQAELKLDKGSGQHEINFVLDDQTGKGVRFNSDDPIWVDEDAPCPPTPGVTTDQLTVTGCTADMLSTTNANEGRPRQLRYQLNFIANDGSRPSCDPIIDNGGNRS